jgi:hypothetical protein
LEEYEIFAQILKSEDTFETEGEKLLFEQTGFQDKSVREDMLQEEEFRTMNDKTI